MSDIVELLRNGTGDGLRAFDLMNQAADEIERLRAALREYVCDCPKNSCAYFPCGGIARAALDVR